MRIGSRIEGLTREQVRLSAIMGTTIHPAREISLMAPNTDEVFRRSEILFRALIEHAPDTITMLDRAGTILYISPAIRQYEYEPKQLVGQPVWPLIHPNDAGHVRQMFDRVARQPGAIAHFQHRIRCGSGAYRDLETTLQNLLDDPSVAAIVVNNRDITDRREAERQLERAHEQLRELLAERTSQLRRSEARYERLIDNLRFDYVFFQVDRDGLLTSVSPSVQEVLGFSAAELVGQHVRELLTDNPINQVVWRRLQQIGTGEMLPPVEVVLRHADGGTRIVEYVTVPIFDGAGQVIGTEGIAKDVTAKRRMMGELRRARDELEQRVAERTAELTTVNEQLRHEVAERARAEQEARQNAERLRGVIEDQTEFIVRWLPNGKRTFVNSSYCRYFGKSEQELVGESFLPLIVDDDREEVLGRVARLTPDNPTVVYEHRVARPDGSIGWMQWSDRALYDSEGKVVEYQSVGRDVTDLKETQEQLARQQVELAHVSRLSLMGEMVASIAHEIGQPLHVISTFAAAIRKSLKGDETTGIEQIAEWVDQIAAQVARSDAIIRRLRNFVRLRPEDKKPLRIAELVRESVLLIAPDTRNRHVQVEVEVPNELAEVLGDRVQLEQVLVNLLRNAAEAMSARPRDERTIHVTAKQTDRRVQLAVRDSGEGIPVELLETCFDPFHTTKPEGMGMGLAISRRIVEMHGGHLWAERNGDDGMTFHLELPIANTSKSPRR